MRKWNANRFFIDAYRPKLGGKIVIEDKEQRTHITSSLRLGVGAQLELCFYDGLECIGEITEIGKFSIELKNIEDCVIATELPVKVDLYQGIPKLKKIDLIVQKAVECGVHSITPVNMQHCVANIREEKKEKKSKRLQKIALSAAEQSKRLYVPEVREAVQSADLPAILEDYDLVILADEDLSAGSEEGASQTLKTIAEKIRAAQRIAIIVGPEGGISDAERALLAERADSVSLGSRILRTETVAIFMLAQISYIVS